MRQFGGDQIFTVVAPADCLVQHSTSSPGELAIIADSRGTFMRLIRQNGSVVTPRLWSRTSANTMYRARKWFHHAENTLPWMLHFWRNPRYVQYQNFWTRCYNTYLYIVVCLVAIRYIPWHYMYECLSLYTLCTWTASRSTGTDNSSVPVLTCQDYISATAHFYYPLMLWLAWHRTFM